MYAAQSLREFVGREAEQAADLGGLGEVLLELFVLELTGQAVTRPRKSPCRGG